MGQLNGLLRTSSRTSFGPRVYSRIRYFRDAHPHRRKDDATLIQQHVSFSFYSIKARNAFFARSTSSNPAASAQISSRARSALTISRPTNPASISRSPK